MANQLADVETGICCEVAILWGTTVLEIAHLTPPRNYFIGDGETKQPPCDFVVPAQKLGMALLPLVRANRASVAVVLPPNASGTVEFPDQPRRTVAEVRAFAETCSDVDGGHQLPLRLGAKVAIEIGELTFCVAMGRAYQPMRHGIQRTELAVLGYWSLSLAFVSALLTVMSLFTAPLGLTEDDGEDRDQLYLVQQYLASNAERERATKPPEQIMEKMENEEGGTGTRSKGEEGSKGLDLTRRTNRSYAVRGNVLAQDPQLARAVVVRDAQAFGMIGLLKSRELGDPSVEAAPWGDFMQAGADMANARGGLWGRELGDARGASGFGLSGIGEGGGGRGEGIGLGNIGTLGHGSGTGDGEGFGNGSGRLYGCGCGEGNGGGFGGGWGRLGGSHKTMAPKVRLGTSAISGYLALEVVQRVVRQNIGRMRNCYEQGLTRSPNLEGRVSVRFVIDRDGTVSSVRNGGSDLQDSEVVGCILRSYYGLSFPEPKSGVVTVVYPLEFVRT